MLSNCFSIISRINNITSNKNKVVNTTFLSCPFYKKHFDNYIALSNQKSFEIYSKYNTNTFPKFSVLDKKQNKNPDPNIKKYFNSPYVFIFGSGFLFYIFSIFKIK